MSKKKKSAQEVIPSCRESRVLRGHEEAETTLANSFKTGRIPHSLLITGPKGIGKATLMYRFARYVLSSGTSLPNPVLDILSDRPLDMGLKDDVFARVATGTHADLFVLEKGINPRTGRARGEITVDEARGLVRFLTLTPAESSWRIAIVDAADEMNRNAANAILKSLEEPPKQAILVLISHAPNRLLPTIRSRCRRINLRPLSRSDFETVVKNFDPSTSEGELDLLGRLSKYSPGQAFLIKELAGIQLYEKIVKILISAPIIDFESVHSLADELGGLGPNLRFKLAMELLLDWISVFITSSAQNISLPEIVKGEQAARERFIAASGLDHWARLWENINRIYLRAEQVHLDRKQVVLSTYTAIGDLAKI